MNRQTLELPTIDNFLSDIKLKLRLAQDALVAAQAIQLKNANKKRREVQELAIGDTVWLKTEHIDLANVPELSSKKLQDKFIGPFPIIKIIVPKTTYKIELPSNWKIHPVFHVSKLKKCIEQDDLFESREALRPLPEIIEDQPEYEVERIVDRRIRYRKLQYLVKWKGYPDYENTWEPLDNLMNADEAIQAYELSYSLK